MSSTPVIPPEDDGNPSSRWRRTLTPDDVTSPDDTSMTYWHTAFRDHGPAVFAFLNSRTRRREDAEDLLQETFVRAIRATENMRDRSRMRAYLLTTAHNLMINAYRKKKPILFSEGGSSTEHLEESTPSVTEPPDARARLGDLEERLSSVLDELTPTLKTAFEMAILGQKSYDEICRETGWSPGQVRVNVFRARRRVIEQLGEWLPPAEDPQTGHATRN